MEKKRANARFSDRTKQVEISLMIFLWQEETIFYVYSPALDLTGNGLTKKEARESFETVLQEFLIYTHENKTIYTELEKLGWSINKIKGKVISPDFEELLTENEHFNHLYKSHNLIKDSSNFSLQLA